MQPLSSPVDAAVRQRLHTALDETLLVSAGAGTGKTTALVQRLVALIASGRAGIDTLAAITFTEAAAAELRARLRRELEACVQAADVPEAVRERCRAALAGLDEAAIQTLHGFARLLLQAHPLEAGLPPVFSVAEDLASELRFAARWQQWLEQALASPPLAPVLLRALKLGLSLEQLRAVAAAFHFNYDLLTAPFPVAPDPPRQVARALVDACPALARLVSLARRGTADPLAHHVRRVLELGEMVRQLGPDSDDALLWLREELACRQGRQSDWERDPQTGENACKVLKRLLAELEQQRRAERAAVCRALLLHLLEALRRFTLESAAARQRAGQAEFHDLLVWARDLLRDHPEVRAALQARFRYLLVDEFQDTDPLQAEIAFYLASEAGEARGGEEGQAWWHLRLRPGALCLVGDAKQSIYRFRRADLATWQQVAQALGSAPVALVQNFRAQAPLVAWVNALFHAWMGEGEDGVQAPYQPLVATWPAAATQPSPGVYWFGGPRQAGVEAVRREQAALLVRFLRAVRTTPWQVRDMASGVLRPARYQDVCLLLPQRRGLPMLEQALEEAAIPYRVESQTLVLASEDVRELLACLRAIDTPADPVAVVAALRSTAFGCSDVELLQWVEGGGRFNPLDPGEATGPVGEALAVLAAYHQRRQWEPVALLIERFVRERRLIEASFARPRPRERWRRLRFVLEQARAFTQVGGQSLRAFLDWLERQAAEGVRQVDVPAPEGDEEAVRVMTIHAAKGLEFPIVVLVDLDTPLPARRPPVLFDRQRCRVEVRLDDDFCTAGYEEAETHERAALQAERVRLLYVAATRARDYLVISLLHPSGRRTSPAAQLLALAQQQPLPWHELVLPEAVAEERGPAVGAVTNLAALDGAEARRRWAQVRQQLLARASAPAAVAVTQLAQLAAAGEEELGSPHGRGGTQLGRAVHAVLQSVDLSSGAALEALCRAQAAAEGIGERWSEVLRLARRALASPVVRRAVASGRYYRELFVSVPVAGVRLEGFIDLLFEEDGAWVLVDYKTDAHDFEAGRLERYALQVGAYALAVAQATGRGVREAVLLFLQAGMAKTYENLAALMAQAQARVEAMVRESLREAGSETSA
ncbi:MAG: ATP-dependent DNA helicase [Candidatus Tectimicrobiota bacterium]|nr:MAG: ATP-dependent DNA helicase [Candidatus Tectomicrobia bacterium]